MPCPRGGCGRCSPAPAGCMLHASTQDLRLCQDILCDLQCDPPASHSQQLGWASFGFPCAVQLHVVQSWMPPTDLQLVGSLLHSVNRDGEPVLAVLLRAQGQHARHGHSTAGSRFVAQKPTRVPTDASFSPFNSVSDRESESLCLSAL